MRSALAAQLRPALAAALVCLPLCGGPRDARAQEPPAAGPAGPALSLSLDDVPDATLGLDEPEPEPEAEAAPDDAPPGLAEAAGDAVDQVLSAAGRDARDFAERTSALQQRLSQNLRQIAWDLQKDPAGTIDGWLAHAGLPSSSELALPAAVVLVALVAVLLAVRVSGDLKVAIGYPQDLRGCFHVRIARKPSGGRRGPRIASPAAAERAKKRAGASSATERHLVARETDFHKVRTGLWYVSIEGFVQPSDDEAVVGTYHDEQEVRVRRGATVRVEFDFHPKQAPVDVKVTWDKRPVQEARLAWRGVPDSLRFLRGAPVRMGAPQGDQVLVVGSGDRVAEVPVTIDSFAPRTVELDLADRDRILFTGCPPAVEPYLNGDVATAARALEREGRKDVSHLLLARLHEDRGQLESAARHYQDAGDPLRAAEIREEMGQYDRSAALYEKAGEQVRAAELYRSAGDVGKAGAAYERARDFESAIHCFQEAGNVSKWVELLERSGKPFAAARVALDNGDESRAVRSLQIISPNDEDYIEASNLLVDVLEREGHLDLAADRVQQVINARGAQHVPLDTCERLAGLLEETGQFERALDMLDVVRRRDATRPNVATRIEELRKKRAQMGSNPGMALFNSDFRYEILEEVGRGGMGIVFKARDRRLGRVVALKRLPDNLRNHPKAVELFLREARAAAAMNHPNIVTVHDAGQEGETFYITMELLEGYPLNNVLQRNGKLSPKDAARLGLQVANGLAYAHQMGVVHRDVKTSNLFFTKAKTIKIMDFGLAKMTEEVRRSSTVIGGTPYYMAPEQGEGTNVDGRADLYALGVTFFELLTGKVPYPDGDVAYHHRHSPVPDPRDKVPQIPSVFAELVMHLMAKKPEDRPADAGIVRDRLQAVLDGRG